MGWVHINPRSRETLHGRGVVSPSEFLRLPGVILCGHPDRHVLRVGLSARNDESAILKKEHRVPWRDRLANALAGFGFVSKSTREAIVLERALQAGIACPEVIAHGQEGGRAFLMLTEKSGATDLRVYISRFPNRLRGDAKRLGHAVARMHAAGFLHGDLYAKHIVVDADEKIFILDWQQARQYKTLSWKARCNDVAALDATLSESLLSNRVRLMFLHAYRIASGANSVGTFAKAAKHIRAISLKLARKSRIQDMRQLPLPHGTQNLVWLDGEAMCVTQRFYREFGGHAPDWLQFRSTSSFFVKTTRVALSEGPLIRLCLSVH